MGKQPSEKKIKFKYVIPEDLRDYYINGAWGGVTPRNEIQMHLYSERIPLPLSMVHEVKPDGTLHDKGEVKTGGDVVRLVQASLMMNVSTAIALRNWLDDKIKFIQKQNAKKGGNNEPGTK